MAIRIDGKALSMEIRAKIKRVVEEKGIQPHLVCFMVGKNPASEVYVRNKVKAGEGCGFKVTVERRGEEITEEELLKDLEYYNNDPEVNGLFVQLPLPGHINPKTIFDSISPEKDVDGLGVVSLGRLFQDRPSYIPATPQGILTLLDHYKIDVCGKKVVIVGRSEIVGKPMLGALCGKKYNATVTLCHSKTPPEDLERFLGEADIVIAAVGIPKFIRKCKIGATLIDVGINRMPDGSLCGDVDIDALLPHLGAYTPVPGGVGPMTIASLLQNTLKSSLHGVL